MGYKVTKGDVDILCDTAEEAIALAKALGGTDHQKPRKAVKGHEQESESRWTESRYREFMSLIKGWQKDFLDLLLKDTDGKTDRVIRQVLGMKTNYELAGVTSGLVKNANKVGILSSSEVFTKETMHRGNERVLEYKISDAFRAVAAKVGIKEK